MARRGVEGNGPMHLGDGTNSFRDPMVMEFTMSMASIMGIGSTMGMGSIMGKGPPWVWGSLWAWGPQWAGSLNGQWLTASIIAYPICK